MPRALQKFSRRTLAVALSGVTINPAVHAIRVYDGSAGTEFDKKPDNEDSPFLGGKGFAVSNKRAFTEGDLIVSLPVNPGDLVDGVSPHAIIFKACGFAENISEVLQVSRYSPVSADFEEVDFKHWHAGDLIDVTNARGTLTGVSIEVNERPKMRVRLLGSYENVVDDDLPTNADTSSFVKMKPARGETNTSLNNVRMRISTLGASGITNLPLNAKSLKWDLGATVEKKSLSELSESGITARVPTFTAIFKCPAVADIDLHAIRDEEELITLYMRQHDADGRYFLSAVRGQIDQITSQEIQGDKYWQITGECIPSATGGDEVYFEYGNRTFRIGGDITATTGQEGVAYVFDEYLELGDFATPLVWTISAGALPAGLSINAATGEITGTPTENGNFNFTVTATDDDGATANLADVLTIDPP